MNTRSGPAARPALVAARKRLGWNQEAAAEAIKVSASTWARWERGEHDIRAAHRARLVEVFATTPAEVERWIEGCPHPDPFPWAGEWGSVGTVETAIELWRWDVDPSRRGLLAALPFVPAFLSEWLLGWSLDPGTASRARSGPGPAVGIEDVHRVREATAAFVQMDRQFGGGLVRPTVVDYLHTQVDPLLNGTYSDEVGAELMVAAAHMTNQAGWEAYDLLEHGLAQVHYGQALRLAKAGDDPLTSALILRDMAQQALDLRHPQWAVRLARAARNAGQQAQAGPRVQSILMLREAQATALVVELSDTHDEHTAGRVRRLLGEAEETFAQAKPGDDEPAWASSRGWGPAVIAAESGCAWRMIGDHARAAACADTALAGFGTASPRSTQLNKIYSAQALLGLGELDQALDVARGAVPMANSLTSRRSVARIKAFDRELAPYAGEPRVRHWRDYLRSELHTTAA